MKKQVLFTGILFLSFFVFTLCSNSRKNAETAPDPTLLHNDGAKLWVLSEMRVNDEVQDISTLMDEHLLLASDLTGIQIFGETDTHPADTLTVDHFTYQLTEPEGKIAFSEFHESHIMANHPVLDIVKLTEEKLELSATAEEEGETFQTELVYVRAVEPNPEAGEKNKMLTNGSLKLWKVSEVLLDGEPTNIPCLRDDIQLRLTNGMGIKIFGDMHCIPGDTINNDIFSWEFIEGETKIVRTDLHASWKHENGSELVMVDTLRIIELTDLEFTWEGTNQIDGVTKHVRITEVPVD